jgi:H+/Cl- antiporter ClcA
MESVVSMSVAACISFVMFYQYCNYFELEHFTQAGVALSVDWQYSNNQCGMAILIGIVSAGICLLVVIFMGIMRQIFNRIRDKVDLMTPLNGTIVCAVLGGVLVGTISWVLPLTIGDGSLGTSAAIRLTFQESHYSGERDEPQYMTAQLLLHSAIGKIFTLAVSLNCGFAGGFVFPMLSIGTFAGCVMALYYPSLPVGFCVSCFMAAVPAGICPMPFTLLGIAVYCFYFGIYQTVPIFISIITSYTVICGSGLFGILAHRGNEAAELRKSEMREREANKHQPDHSGEASFPYVAPSPVVVNPMSTSNSLKAPLI